jgi:hypothetical protein
MSMSHHDKNKKIAAIFLQNNSHKEKTASLWPGVLKAVKAIESCPHELVKGSAKALYFIGNSFGQEVDILFISSSSMYIDMHFNRSMQSSRIWKSQRVKSQKRKRREKPDDQRA